MMQVHEKKRREYLVQVCHLQAGAIDDRLLSYACIKKPAMIKVLRDALLCPPSMVDVVVPSYPSLSSFSLKTVVRNSVSVFAKAPCSCLVTSLRVILSVCIGAFFVTAMLMIVAAAVVQTSQTPSWHPTQNIEELLT